MAGSDVFGILSLLVAAGGAVYLLRARFGARAADPVTVPSDGSRSAKTVPPKLRPPDDGPEGDRARTMPSVPPPPRVPQIAEPSSARTPAAKAAAPPPSAKVPVATADAPPVSEAKPKSEGAAAAKASPAKETQPEAAASRADAKADAKPASDPKPRSNPKPSERRTASAASRLEGAKPAEPAASPMPAEAAPAKASPKSAPDPKPKSTPKPAEAAAPKSGEATRPADAPVRDRSSKITKPDAPRRSAASEPDAKASESKSTWSKEKARASTVDELPVIPTIESDEDEDVEPTRVGKLTRKEIQPPVEKHIFDEGADQELPAGLPPWKIEAVAQTDPGRRRKQNEDSYLVLDAHGVFLVADGMGGHRGGQVASKLAVKTIEDAFEQKKFEAAAHPGLPVEASELARAIQMANAAILAEATARDELRGMGTTLCSARFTNGGHRLFLGHVGDSRCYRIRDGAMKQMTNDHTMADYGVTGPEGAHLSRAVGVWPTVPIDIIMATPQVGDLYLICSDGLTKMLPHETIATQLVHEEDVKAAVGRLVFFANAHGGKDNITIVVLRVLAA